MTEVLKPFVVGFISFHDNELHMHTVAAANEVEALILGYIKCSETTPEEEIREWLGQYVTVEEIKTALLDCDSVIEVHSI